MLILCLHILLYCYHYVQELNSSMFYSVQRLAAGEWFTARVSSCGLFHIAYPSAPDQLKAELRTIYGQLCQDDMPMVRRAAASNLGKFAATVEQSHLKTEIMSIFDDLTQDGIFLIHVIMNCSVVLHSFSQRDNCMRLYLFLFIMLLMLL